MISALPSSLHSHTLALICSRTSALISPVSPEKSARKPCVRLLMTSISCRDTVWTTSFLFCSSPSGHCTNWVYRTQVQWICILKSCQIKSITRNVVTLQTQANAFWETTWLMSKKHWRWNCIDATDRGYLSSHGIVVSGSGEGAAQLADFSSGFVNCNNISEKKIKRRKPV